VRAEVSAGSLGIAFRSAAKLAPTPRSNAALPQNLGNFSSLSKALDYAAQGETGFNFYSARGVLGNVLSYERLRREAIATAERLIRLGLSRGDRVAVPADTGEDFLKVFFGCQYAGLVPCPIPYSMHLGGKDAYVERIAGMLRCAQVTLIVSPEELVDHLSEAAALARTELVLKHSQLPEVKVEGTCVQPAPFGDDEAAYIQYSSGSTSEPKGVLIMQKSITANARAILQFGLKVGPQDRAFSWLPFYHDMGLVGFCIAPMMGQVSTDYLPTTAFARRPALWLKLMSDNRSTITYSPTFGYQLAGRRINGDAGTLDLSSIRVAGIGGDMVRPDVLNEFAERMKVAGFCAKALLPSYGMAESTLAITFADLDEPLRVDVVDSVQFKLRRRAVPVGKGCRLSAGRQRAFVVCGRPLPGHEVRIVDAAGKTLAEREVGRILVKGPSLMAGYFGDQQATNAVMRSDGFMDTGDMGYLVDRQVVVTGRAKDLILHNGRNIWPQDLEWAAEQIEPLRSGDVAAFAVEGRYDEDEVVVLIQCRISSATEMENLRRRVQAAIHRAAGIDCSVVLVPPRSLPFTSSGKLSRALARARYLSGDIAEISGAIQKQAQPRIAAAL
jgi:fatty-acyl-CoA synthase